MLGGYPLWLVRTINFSLNFKNQLGIGSDFSKLEMELESYIYTKIFIEFYFNLI